MPSHPAPSPPRPEPGVPAAPHRWSGGLAALIVVALASIVPAGLRGQNAETPAVTEEDTAAARAALDAGRPEEAERLYRQRLLTAPDDLSALLGWAEALRLQDRGETAWPSLLRAAERLAASRPEAAVELLESARRVRSTAELEAALGRALLLSRRYRAAEAPLERALEGERRPEWLFLAGSAAWENGDLGRAQRLYREAFERSGGSPAYAWELARLLLWQGEELREVEVLLERVRATGQDGFAVHLDLARTREALAQGSAGTERRDWLEAAERSYAAAAERAPGHSEVRYGWARVLRALGRNEDSERQLRHFQELVREDRQRTQHRLELEARIGHALELARDGDIDVALRELRSLPEDPGVLHAVALVQHARGEREAAIAALERALALEPGRRDLEVLLSEWRRETRSASE